MRRQSFNDQVLLGHRSHEKKKKTPLQGMVSLLFTNEMNCTKGRSPLHFTYSAIVFCTPEYNTDLIKDKTVRT